MKCRITLIIFFGLIASSCSSLPTPTLFTKADAIVILSGNYQERAPVAAKLLAEGFANRIILTNDGVFSSWSAKHDRNLYQIEWAEEKLLSLGARREQIVKLPEFVDSTMSEAALASRYIKREGFKKIIIVTSEYHVRRALWSFGKAFENYPVELMMSPAPSSSSGIKIIAIEFAKLIYYKVRYGLI